MELLTTLLLFSLPLIPLVWWLPERWQLAPIGLATAIFLGVYSPISLALLATTTVTTWWLINRFQASSASLAITVIVQSVAIFIFFKLHYGKDLPLTYSRVIPIGLSYYTFRQIHYAIEAYKQELPRHDFHDYFNYLFFLPTLLVGPINRFQDFQRDTIRRRWDAVMFSNGLQRILYGYAKIVIVGNYLLSNRLARFIDGLYETSPWLATYLQTFKFAGNAYMQFAGFSDVAIGLSLLLGFRVLENFNYPFLALNLVDFWNRWHISLSSWCRDYVYYPIMAMSRNSYIAIFSSMIILGGWHEISARYILWGLMHAGAINIVHFLKKIGLLDKLQKRVFGYRFWSWLLTIHFVVFSFVLLGEENLEASYRVYRQLLGMD